MITRLLIILSLLFQSVFSLLLTSFNKENPVRLKEIFSKEVVLPLESSEEKNKPSDQRVVLGKKSVRLSIEPDTEIPKIPQKISDNQEIKIFAKAALVMDRKSKAVLFEKNAYQKLSQASLTKIMSALIVLESGINLDQMITVSSQAANIEPKDIRLQAGEKMTAKDLLYASLLASANDAVLALAEYVGPGVNKFVEKMNKKAEDLKLRDTHFANPTGLDKEENYSTAYDLARLLDYALENEVLRKILGTKEYTAISSKGQKHWFKDTNDLLGTPGILGGKTGFTDKAGWCLAEVAQNKQGNEIISIVLGAPSKEARFQETKDLIDWTFRNYKWE